MHAGVAAPENDAVPTAFALLGRTHRTDGIIPRGVPVGPGQTMPVDDDLALTTTRSPR